MELKIRKRARSINEVLRNLLGIKKRSKSSQSDYETIEEELEEYNKRKLSKRFLIFHPFN